MRALREVDGPMSVAARVDALPAPTAAAAPGVGDVHGGTTALGIEDGRSVAEAPATALAEPRADLACVVAPSCGPGKGDAEEPQRAREKLPPVDATVAPAADESSARGLAPSSSIPEGAEAGAPTHSGTAFVGRHFTPLALVRRRAATRGSRGGRRGPSAGAAPHPTLPERPPRSGERAERSRVTTEVSRERASPCCWRCPRRPKRSTRPRRRCAPDCAAPRRSTRAATSPRRSAPASWVSRSAPTLGGCASTT